MTLFTIAAGLAKNVGLAVPTVIVSSALREWSEGLQMANEVGDDLSRRVDWGVLHEEATLTGDGTDKAHAMPAQFARLSPGIAIRVGTAAVRPLTRPEWNALTPMVGTPRYFILETGVVHLWPYLANAATVTASYQSRHWSNTGPSFMADDNYALINEGLFLKALIVRWRRQKAMDYADHETEFEASLQDIARFDDRGRV